MTAKPDYDTASILDHAHCRECGWPIIFLCCNGPLGVQPPYEEWDWWYYCANPTCSHHTGEGVFQFKLEWIEEEQCKPAESTSAT